MLANGLTSENLIKNIVSQAFVDSGYRIVTEDPDNKAVHVDIVVDKFWGWFSPGFWTISVYANTELTLDMKHDLKSEKNPCISDKKTSLTCRNRKPMARCIFKKSL